MILRTTKGSRFVTLAGYLLRGSDNDEDRAAWVATRNVVTQDADKAARLMEHTFAYADTLKEQAGIRRGGRKAQDPVFHLVLSWHKDDAPSREHMEAAADNALEWLGMKEHQAVLVCHTDGNAPHLHVMVNRTDPRTGVLAKLNCDRLVLSKWADQWENTHGLVKCEERTTNLAKREEAKETEKEESGFVKHQPDPRSVEQDKDAQPKLGGLGPTPYTDELARLHADDRKMLNESQARERLAMIARQKAEMVALKSAVVADENKLQRSLRAQNDNSYEGVRQKYRPIWRTVFKRQRQERAELQAAGPVGRVKILLREREYLETAERGSILGALLNTRATREKIFLGLERRHEQERRRIGTEQTLVQREMKRRNERDFMARGDAMETFYKEKIAERQNIHIAELSLLDERHYAERSSTADQQRNEGAPAAVMREWVKAAPPLVPRTPWHARLDPARLKAAEARDAERRERDLANRQRDEFGRER